MNQKPKNTTIFTLSGRAEIFWQTVNCDHFMDNYREDLRKSGKGRFHDLKFTEMARLLSGNVAIDPVSKSGTKWRAISFWEGRYYLTYFHLEKRNDCDTLFAVIITCYATHHESHKKEYEKYLASPQKK